MSDRSPSPRRITVLYGGWSREREVSLLSAPDIIEALEALGHHVTPIDVTRDIGKLLQGLDPKPDLVFNGLYGTGGEDGCIQGLLEALRIPFTHSGVLASALAMDKPVAKKMFESVGIRTPCSCVLNGRDIFTQTQIPFPFVVKPPADGSSMGVNLLHGEEDLKKLKQEFQEEHPAAFDQIWLVEAYIPGRELSVAVFEGKAMGTMEVRPKEGFYDYRTKYTDGLASHHVPAPVSKDVEAQIKEWAEKAHQVLGCQGISRSDFRYDDSCSGVEGLYLLELNTQPGLTRLSFVPEIAQHQGLSFNSLLEKIIDSVRCPA